jgi:hypothetical protein
MSSISYDWIRLAEEQVLGDYGDRVSILQKRKTLLKFGRTEEVTTTSRTIAQLGAGQSHETYVSDNLITHISSSNDDDEQKVVIEYHTIANGVFTFGTQLATLDGQTAVPLTVPAARVSRLYNNSGTVFGGNIYVFENDTLSSGVPQNAAKVHLAIPTGKNQSFKAATTISDGDYYFITQLFASVNKKVSAQVDVELEIRWVGGVFRQQFPTSLVTDGTTTIPPTALEPYIIVPRNADVRMTAVSLASSGIAVSGGFNGLLATVLE